MGLCASKKVLASSSGKGKKKANIQLIMQETEIEKKWVALCSAVLSNYAQSERIIGEGVDLNERCYGGRTAVHLAVCRNLPDVLEAFIYNEADLNIPQLYSSGFTPLISAIQNDNVAIVRQLLYAGADPEKSDSNGKTPLLYAAMHSPKSIELLFKVGANFKCMTPLIYAITSDRIEIVKELLNGGADPLKADCRGETALHHAARYSVRSLELLLKKGYYVDVIGQCDNFRNRRSPLMAAADAGNLTTLLLLLNNGAYVNMESGDFKTALHFAKSGRVVEILWEWGADINAWDVDGNTPLHWAADQNNEEVIEALLTFGPPPRDFISHSFNYWLIPSVNQIMMKFNHFTFINTTPLPCFEGSEDFVRQCSLEVERMKKTNCRRSVFHMINCMEKARFVEPNLFQVLTKGLTHCTFAANAEICELIENEELIHHFPLYHNILRRHLRIAKRRHSLITGLVERNFQNVKLPEEVRYMTLAQMSSADMIRLYRTLDRDFVIGADAEDITRHYSFVGARVILPN